jgi:hypothetical protein
MRALRLVALAAALSGAAGCGTAAPGAGADRPAVGDAGPVDTVDSGQADTVDSGETAPADAGDGPAPCSLGPSPGLPAPTHTAVLVYDTFLEQPDCPTCNPQPNFDLFVDAEGIAAFGDLSFRRVTLDGALVRTVDYPPNPNDPGHPVSYSRAAQGGSGYGVLYSAAGPTVIDYRFCVFDEQGATDWNDCLPNGGFPAWDGSAFYTLGSCDRIGYVDVNMCLQQLSPEGVLTNTTRFPRFDQGSWALPLFIENYLVMHAVAGRQTPTCRTALLDVVPRSLDFAQRRTWDVLPADYRSDSVAYSLSNGRRAALFSEAECGDPGQPDCHSSTLPYWPATLLTIVAEDGAPLAAPKRIPAPPSRLVWDGTRVLFLTNKWPYDPQDPENYGGDLHAFDEGGEIVVWNARLPLRFTWTGEPFYGAVLAAVGENDYIVIYGLNSGHWIARFSLVPL